MPADKSARRRGVLLVLAATVMWGLAGVFARLLGHLDLWTVMGWRATLGAAAISAVAIVRWRLGVREAWFGFGWLSPLASALALVAISAYTAAAMTTTIADVMIIYATIPFIAAAIGWLVNREPVSPRTVIAGVVAFAGVAVMVGAGFGSGRLLGQALAAVMTVAFAGMVVMQRNRPNASMIAVNAFGAFGSGMVGFAMSPHPPLGPYELGVLFLFGLTTIGLAFVLFMEGAKLIPSAEAGLITMLDVVLGPLWVFLAFAENPGVPTVIGGAIVLGAALWRMAPDLRGEAVG